MGASTSSPERTELKESIDVLLDEIANGTDTWQGYTDRLAAERTLGSRIGLFQTWSVSNRLYLRSQVARRKSNVKGLYAGAKQWSTHNRSVLDGAKPYYIYGPPTFLIRNPPAVVNPAPVTPATPAPNAVTVVATPAAATPTPVAPPAPVRGFRRPPVIEVFDWTQTVSNDPDYTEPDWTTPLAGGTLDTYYDLATTAPVQVTATNLAFANQHSWLDASGITVDSSLEAGGRIFEMVVTLAHHHLGHLGQVSTTLRPTYCSDTAAATYDALSGEAALTAYVAMQMLGLDLDTTELAQLAATHLKAWVRIDADGNTVAVEGYKLKRKLIMRRLEAAFKAADAIVEPVLAGRTA